MRGLVGQLIVVIVGVWIGTALTRAVPTRPPASQNGRAGGDGQAGREEAKPSHDPGRSAAEWVSLGVSGLIVLSVVGLVGYHHLTSGGEPAVIGVEPRLGETRTGAGRFYVPVTVANQGGRTAEEVRVRVVLSASGAEEAAELTIPFLAGRATQDGVVSFRADPSRGELRADVLSYLEP